MQLTDCSSTISRSTTSRSATLWHRQQRKEYTHSEVFQAQASTGMLGVGRAKRQEDSTIRRSAILP
jgi:hypothetical protein